MELVNRMFGYSACVGIDPDHKTWTSNHAEQIHTEQHPVGSERRPGIAAAYHHLDRYREHTGSR